MCVCVRARVCMCMCVRACVCVGGYKKRADHNEERSDDKRIAFKYMASKKGLKLVFVAPGS